MDPPQLVIDNDVNFPHVDCSYFTDDQFNNAVKNTKMNSFSLLSFNIRSMRRNFTSFLSFLSGLMINLSIIVLVETWLDGNIDHAYSIDGYNELSLHRNRNGGGIKIYIDDKFQSRVLDNLTFVNDIIEVLTICVFCSRFKFYICSIYKPPSSSIVSFIEILQNNLLSEFPVGSKVILCGDLNINLYNPMDLTSTKNFMSEMFSFDFFQS